MAWKNMLAVLFRLATLVVVRVRKKREADLRARVADDPCGVLLDRLGGHGRGKDSADASADKSATSDTGRD